MKSLPFPKVCAIKWIKLSFEWTQYSSRHTLQTCVAKRARKLLSKGWLEKHTSYDVQQSSKDCATSTSCRKSSDCRKTGRICNSPKRALRDWHGRPRQRSQTLNNRRQSFNYRAEIYSQPIISQQSKCYPHQVSVALLKNNFTSGLTPLYFIADGSKCPTIYQFLSVYCI